MHDTCGGTRDPQLCAACDSFKCQTDRSDPIASTALTRWAIVWRPSGPGATASDLINGRDRGRRQAAMVSGAARD